MVNSVGYNVCSCAPGLAAVPAPKENIVLMATDHFSMIIVSTINKKIPLTSLAITIQRVPEAPFFNS